MAEDRGDPRQGQVDVTSASRELIEKIFKEHKSQAWITAALKGDKASWAGSFFREDRLAAFDPSRGHYIANCLIKPGSASRNLKSFDGGVLVVADDVGYLAPEGAIPMSPGAEVDIHEFEAFAPETSFEIETSQGNFQMNYAIWPPERDLARWGYFFAEIKKHPRFGKAFAKTDAVHYGRLPSGSNQPKPTRPRFRSRLAKDFSGLTWTLDELALAFGIDMAGAGAPVSSGPSPAFPSSGAAETCSMATLHRLMGLLPNDRQFDDRGSWIAVGAAIRSVSEANCCGDEGFQLWLLWCAQRYQDDGAPERLWDSVWEPKASVSTLRKAVETRYGGVFSDEYLRIAAEIAQDQARAGFEAVGPAEEARMAAAAVETAETRKAEKDFRALLKEARALAKIPAAFRRESDDENWLLDGDFEDAFDAARGIQPASPTVFPPFDRGVLSVRAGAPSAGKSLLLLDQSAAFCCERPDLLGTGFGPIQFAGDVLYFCNEDSRSLAIRRLQAWRQKTGAVPRHRLILVKSNLMARAGDKKPPVVECVRVLRVAVEHLRKGFSLPIIVFDTMRASVSGMEENSARETAEAMELMKRIAWAFWAAVIFVHHGTKTAWKEKENEANLSTALAGSGNFGGTVRGADVVRRLDDKEKALKGWAGRGTVIGCKTIKASDDSLSGEQFYELELVQVQVGHAEKAGVMVSKPMPVAVPLVPVAQTMGFTDEIERQAHWDELVVALGRGRVWRYRGETTKGPDDGRAIHEIWKTDVKKAGEMVDSFVAEARINVERKRVSKNVEADEITLKNVENEPW